MISLPAQMISLTAIPDDKLYRAFCPDHKNQSPEEIYDAISATVADWDKSEPIWIESCKMLFFRVKDETITG